MATDLSLKTSAFFQAYPSRTFEKRQILIQAGEQPPGIFYIVKGIVQQYDISAGGNEIVVNVFKPGAFFPMSFAMNNTSNDYFFEARTHTIVHQAPASDTIQFLKDNPDVLYDLLTRVYKGTDGVLRRMAHLMGGDAKSRLLFELANAADRFGKPEDDGSVFVALKEGDLAKHSGLARETVSRVLQTLVTSRLVAVTPSGIIISDITAIRSMLGTGL